MYLKNNNADAVAIVVVVVFVCCCVVKTGLHDLLFLFFFQYVHTHLRPHFHIAVDPRIRICVCVYKYRLATIICVESYEKIGATLTLALDTHATSTYIFFSLGQREDALQSSISLSGTRTHSV